MHTEFLQDAFAAAGTEQAIIWNDKEYTYEYLLEKIKQYIVLLKEQQIRASVVSIEADFSPNSVALIIAAIELSNILVPLSSSVEANKGEFRSIAQVQYALKLDADDRIEIEAIDSLLDDQLLLRLLRENRPGLVLFSSGSTGKSKAALHDLIPLLEKFKVKKRKKRMITFLLFDHIGGINTLFYVLSNGGCIVTVRKRTVEDVCSAIDKYGVEILPTSPTFINLMLIGEAHAKYELSSLETVTYGTEVMPESTLKRFHELFPGIELLQTYGLSEIGIMRSRSKSSDSLWVKIGGEGFEYRIVDQMLEIKAQSAMIGYLNAPSPFTEDGWFKTGDIVEVEGDYVKILGRKSEIINVGGEKVYPAEVESALRSMDGVFDATVTGESNLLTGNIVTAVVKLSQPEPAAEFRKRMRLYLKDKLAPFKIPQKVRLTEEFMHGERFKKMRKQ